MNFIAPLLNISFNISICQQVTVGNPNRYPELFSWNTDLNSKFINWNYYRIWAIVDGSGTIETSFGNYTLKKGQLYYLPACSIYKTDVSDKMTQYYIDFLPDSTFTSMESSFEFKNIREKEFSLVVELMKKLESVYKKNDSKSLFMTHSIMSTIFSFFYSNSTLNSTDFNKLLPAVTYIEKNYTKPITLKELSGLTHYSPEYFSLLFKKFFNVSPIQFLIKKRINEAKRLLILTPLPIGSIAKQVGFEDQLYFSRIFLQHTHTPPSDFRKNIKASIINNF